MKGNAPGFVLIDPQHVPQLCKFPQIEVAMEKVSKKGIKYEPWVVSFQKDLDEVFGVQHRETHISHFVF